MDAPNLSIRDSEANLSRLEAEFRSSAEVKAPILCVDLSDLVDP